MTQEYNPYDLHKLYERCKTFGIAAHRSIDQRRKYSNEPYEIHPAETAKIVLDATGDLVLAAAMYIHDVFEDVAIKNSNFDVAHARAFIRNDAPIWVALELTDVYTKELFPNLNRAARHRLENIRLGKISDRGQTGKVADLISNTASIVQEDPKFARLYLREKQEVLFYLSHAHPALLAHAKQQVVDGLEALEI